MPAPPYSSANLDAQQVQAGELLQQIHRKVLRLVPLHDVRADFAFRERAHRATQDFLLLGRPKVHGTRLPRRHHAAGLWIDRRMRYDRAMTTRVFRTVLACVVALLVYPSAARADITGFLGVTTTPSSRPAVGFAVGAGLLIVGAEFEYSHSNEDLTELAPSLRTFMFNGLLQTPIPIAGIQFYGEAGGGVYHETLSVVGSPSETNFGINIGGGAKISLVGPLRLRLDYRVFTLKGNAQHANVQRLVRGIEPEVLASTYLAAAIALIATASFKLTSVWPSTKQSM